jgi:NAD(P)-dependent dehydrogenase (short-subunit alcohol dehydrogenase family)
MTVPFLTWTMSLTHPRVSRCPANQRAADEIHRRLGGREIAFLDAGTCEYVEVNKFDSALFERTIQTNFLSMVYGIEAVLPLLRQSPVPQLVGMSSTVAYGGLPRSEGMEPRKRQSRICSSRCKSISARGDQPAL